ncbi:cyanophycin synthetase [Dethiobacter alkaliphilus]|uniref:Cyanophycin synthetase n=1 Tax=Dethiobacter alkaliphilus AHT 1 TaxID=555088 RepID=C0GJC4_DETAL|nr:cyanophycin synthetase [Dethiobacter alkaliphilus]EEG76609.1 cyanophycin synthetase [Dethiobacter alkaliphilus AHT 1]
MRIRELSFFCGRNIYSHRPVMKMILDLTERRLFRTDNDPEFARRLRDMLPGLADHHCSRGVPGGFLERMAEGTYLGHVVEHVFLELQNMAGVGTKYGKTINTPDGLTEVICEYRCRPAAELLAKAAVAAVLAALEGSSADVGHWLAEAKKAVDRHMPGPSTAAILAAAKKRHIPIQPLAEENSLYRLGTGKYQKRIMASITEHTSCVAVDIAGSKPLTNDLLRNEGLPVPASEVVYTLADAQAAAERIGYPVVIKPDNGNQGKGVSMNLLTAEEVANAFQAAAVCSKAVMVESYLKGRHYRLLVVNGSMLAAAERIPAHVTGDGLSTIHQLIAQANKDPLRGEGHEKPLTKIVLDQIALRVLEKQGFSPQDVPAAGLQILLRENANLSTGGTAVDVTDEVHPLQEALAVSAVQAVGLDIAGVDVVMEDITSSPESQSGGIIEVNAAPGLRMHLHPSRGKSRDVGKAIVDMLFPPGSPVRVPVFSVTGTNGKTTTARMLEFVMRRHGLYTGICCTDGIYFNGQQVKKGDLTGPLSARTVLAHPDIEVAVLETARGGLIRRGLGYDRADVAVITNIRADHLGQDGIETLDDLAHVKSLVAEAVYPAGCVVLNADEPHVNELAARVWAEVIYVSMQSDNIVVRHHLGKGGRAVFVRRGLVLAAHGSGVVPVGRVRSFVVTHGGRALHQVENLLGALAACWGFGLSPRQAAAYLRTFAAQPGDNPGRCNLYQVGDIRVLVDYGHNADGIEKTGLLAKKLGAERLIGVVGVPGDRSDELVMQAGQAAAGFFDLLVIKEDHDLRGRRPREVAGLLMRGALNAGRDRAALKVEPNERRAVKKALALSRPGDLVVIFYEDLAAVLAEIMERGSVKQPVQEACVAGEENRSAIHPPPAGITGSRANT